MKKILLLAFIFSVAIATTKLTATTNDTIDYLKTFSPDAWIILALEAAGSSGDISNLQFLSNTSVTNASKNLLAVVASGEDYLTFPDQDLVGIIKAGYNDGQLGDSSLVNDDFWGLMALASVQDNFNRENISQFIIDAQNADGGWSYAVGAESDTNDTAAALMALKEAGFSSASTEVSQALNYLQSAQNSDGGIGYAVGQESDAASTAWTLAALNKYDIDGNSWDQGGNNPLTFLESMELTDGSYKWLVTDTEGSVLVTSYALVALSGKSYPVSYVEAVVPIEGTHNLWIEGPDGTICNDPIQGSTVLELVENGSAICNFEYVVEETSFGPYLRSINGFEPAGVTGWLYRVNWQAPAVGADQYILDSGDQVYWYFAPFDHLPTRLTLSTNQVDVSVPVNVKAEYFDEVNWQPLQTTITDGTNTWNTDSSGQVEINVSESAILNLYIPEREGYLKSNTERLLVGDGLTNSVNILVDVLPGTLGYGDGDDDYLAFEVDASNVNFGQLKRGESSSSEVNIINTGNVNFNLEASVEGDSLFVNFLTIDSLAWSNFSVFVEPIQQVAANLGLTIPGDYTSSGIKTGQVIFWAVPE